MSDLQERIADALYQAALEGDESPKMLLSQRVVEILISAPIATAGKSGREHIPVQGDALRDELKRLKISQTKLAAHLGVDKGAVTRIIQGSRSLRWEEAEAIRDLLSGAST